MRVLNGTEPCRDYVKQCRSIGLQYCSTARLYSRSGRSTIKHSNTYHNSLNVQFDKNRVLCYNARDASRRGSVSYGQRASSKHCRQV